MTEITLCYDVCLELTQSARLFRAASQSMFALALPLRLPLSLGSKGKFQSWTDGRTSAKLEAPLLPYSLISSPADPPSSLSIKLGTGDPLSRRTKRRSSSPNYLTQHLK